MRRIEKEIYKVTHSFNEMTNARIVADNRTSEYETMLANLLLDEYIILDSVISFKEQEAIISELKDVLTEGSRTSFSDLATMIADKTGLKVRWVRDYSKNYLFYDNYEKGNRETEIKLYEKKVKELNDKASK